MTLRSALFGTAFALAFGGALGGTAVAEPLDGWYLGLEGGVNWLDDWSHTITNGGTNPGEASFDMSWAALGTVGYKWQNNFRLEFEAGYRENDVDGYLRSGVAQTYGSDVWEASAMANILYDWALTDDFFISLGAGAGGDFSNYTFQIGATSAEDDQWSFAYQGIAGLNYAIGRQTALFVNYRYFRALEPEFDFRPALNVVLFDSDDFTKHTVAIGLRYAFEEPQQSYVETPPPPPESAPQESAPRQFIVFFGFNKYNLTSEALRVISEAVVAARETGSASVLITGHTDTKGSNAYNQQLSMRRSNAVKGEMVRQGISTAAITSTGKGETELLVQTQDGVKEPQNRRATIDLN